MSQSRFLLFHHDQVHNSIFTPRKTASSKILHRSNRLFQEFILSGWLLTETQRLHFQSSNQGTLRADKYSNVQAAVANRPPGENNPIGKKILASSFTGGPRWYHAKYEDAMALVREFHKPDFFITMTCNTK